MGFTKNKRRSERVPSSLPVTWVMRDRSVEVVAADVSAEGMFLRTSEQTTPGMLMRIEVQLPETPPIVLFAMARYIGRTSSGEGIGAEIYVASDADRRRWLKYYRGLLSAQTAQPPQLTDGELA